MRRCKEHIWPFSFAVSVGIQDLLSDYLICHSIRVHSPFFVMAFRNSLWKLASHIAN